MSDQPPYYPPPQQPPPPPPPPGSYGQPYGGFQPAPPSSGKSVAIMVLGIVSLVVGCGLGLISAIVALAMAPGAKREIESSGGRIGGASFVKAGIICSWIAVGLNILGIIFFIIVFAAGGFAATSSNGPSNGVSSSLTWQRG